MGHILLGWLLGTFPGYMEKLVHMNHINGLFGSLASSGFGGKRGGLRADEVRVPFAWLTSCSVTVGWSAPSLEGCSSCHMASSISFPLVLVYCLLLLLPAVTCQECVLSCCFYSALVSQTGINYPSLKLSSVYKNNFYFLLRP